MPVEPRFRLARIRSRTGKTAKQVAEQSGVSVENYHDLEDADDLNDCISLRDLAAVCAAVGCLPADLFSGEADERPDTGPVSFSDLRQRVMDHLKAGALSLPEFEGLVGWDFVEFSKDPDAAWKWNVQCLRDVCDPLKVHWVDALPRRPSMSAS